MHFLLRRPGRAGVQSGSFVMHRNFVQMSFLTPPVGATPIFAGWKPAS